jgi:hypothetical protein
MVGGDRMFLFFLAPTKKVVIVSMRKSNFSKGYVCGKLWPDVAKEDYNSQAHQLIWRIQRLKILNMT